MSAEQVRAISDAALFRPTSKPWLLPAHHVPLDDLLPTDGGYEARALRRLTAPGHEPVAVLGPSGSGKSSLVTWVGTQLPERFVALRVPVSALEDPTDTARGAQAQPRHDPRHRRSSTPRRASGSACERADRRTAQRAPTGFTGGRIGGGPIPAHVDVELGSLRQEFTEERLAGDWLGAVNRALAVLAYEGVQAVFVIEDTEAVVGGGAGDSVIDGFFEGPLRAFVQELAAPCLVAVQTHLTVDRPAFDRLAAVMEVIEIPHLRDEARDALPRILARRLEVGGAGFALGEAIADDALDGLVQFYDDAQGDLRRTLAAAQDAAEDAAAMDAERIRAAHVRVGAANWR